MPAEFAGPVWLGLMSGTSLDGVDITAVRFAPGPDGAPPGRRVQVSAAARAEFDPELQRGLLDLGEGRGDDLHSAMLLEQRLTRAYAQAVAQLRTDLGDIPIAAIGSMGQTVRHMPPRAGPGETQTTDPGGAGRAARHLPSSAEPGYSCQLLDGALLAGLTRLQVVCDLRRSDIAAGGHGAPLACAFHRWAFGGSSAQEEAAAVVNLGGIANATLLGPRPLGFDTGPANILMDGWIQRHQGQPMDRDGTWARSGQPIPALLEQLLGLPWLAQPPPKTTGREVFNQAWLDSQLAACGQRGADPADVQCTLTHFTAASLADALQAHASPGQPPALSQRQQGPDFAADTQPGGQISSLYLCGGGARNGFLRELIRQRLPGAQVRTTAELGLDPDLVECACAAWYAMMRLEHAPCDLRDFTGARAPAVMGARYLPPGPPSQPPT